MRQARPLVLCLGTAIVLGLCHTTPVSALPDVTLWVIQPPGQLVAFDLSDFSRIGGVRIPPVAYNNPGKLSINGHGQFLVQLDDDHIWVWDGDSADTLPVAPDIAPRSDAAIAGGLTPLRQWLLGDDGKSLFVLQSEAREKETSGRDTTASRLVVRQTDLSQRTLREVFSVVSGPCTRYVEPVGGVPCPEPSMWAPGGTVRGYFLLTHCEPEPGNEPSDEEPPRGSCHRARLWGGPRGWQESELEFGDEALPLDATPDGSAWIEVSGESGYGDNEVSDQAIMVSPDTSIVLFDEWTSLRNQGYEVSIFPVDARIAPGSARVAYTLHATASATDSILVSPDEHPDPSRFAAIRSSLSDLPMVEVVDVRPRPTRVLRLAHAELVGWASDSEVIVVEKGRLVGIDVLTKQQRESGIVVRSPADAFVVWR